MADKNLSVEEQIQQVQLETAKLGLEEAKENNEAFKARRDARMKNARFREADLRTQNANRLAKSNGCRHRQGGFAGTPYQKGKGDPCVSCHQMPFGDRRLQCNRCTLEVYEPNPANASSESYRDKDGRTHAGQTALFDKMLELWEEGGLAMSAGPQFTAVKNGIPFRPALV